MKKPQDPLLLSHFISVVQLSSAQTVGFGIESTTVAVRLLARRWGVRLCGSVLPSVWLIGAQPYFMLQLGLRNKNTLSVPVSQNCKPGHCCWTVMWVKMWLEWAALWHKYVGKKVQSNGVQPARVKKGDYEEENNVCFWILWHSYLWIHYRCFLLSLCACLLSLNLKQPIFAPLFSPQPLA